MVLSDLGAGGRAGVLAPRMVSVGSHQHVGYALALVQVPPCRIVREAFVDSRCQGEQLHKRRTADRKRQVISRLCPSFISIQPTGLTRADKPGLRYVF